MAKAFFRKDVKTPSVIYYCSFHAINDAAKYREDAESLLKQAEKQLSVTSVI